MISNHSALPLDALVTELFGRASRRSGLITLGWVLALGSHAGAALLFANQHAEAAAVRTPPPVEVEFVMPPEPEIPVPPAPAPAVPEPARAARAVPANAAPPAAARAGALHLAKADATPAQQPDAAVDFTTDPNAASYGGGVVAVGGTASFGAAGARVVPRGTAPRAAVGTGPVGDGLTPVSDLSRKPRLPGGDPCRGFFPGGAHDDGGDVAVLVTIGKSGRVSRTQLLSESPRGQGFGVAAQSCLASQAFIPALDRAGNSAATAIRVNIRFSR